jgi:SAM-dependent methyltransferase
MGTERTYVIGTHDAEIERLGVQHRVWRPRVLEFWRESGVTEGMTVIDAGAGPGHATLDLAEIVGPRGRVIALERSRRFLDALETAVRARGFANIETVETDLLDFDWSRVAADRLWCRWVLAFVADPTAVLGGMARALKPGGAALFHEYYDYASWRLAPHSPVFENYVAKIIARWRESGGEPDIALGLPAMLAEAGLAVEGVRAHVMAAKMNDFASRWPMGFAREFLATLIASGDVAQAEAKAILRVLDAAEADPNALAITPGVLHIRAVKP